MGGYTATAKTVEWGTPNYVFDPLNREFGFTVDVCAKDGMEVIDRHFNPEIDGLKQNWDNEICWMNCPYGKELPKWVDKAIQSKGITVALLPSKTDTRYFDKIFKTANEVRFVIGRIKFRGTNLPAPFGSMIVVWDGSNRQPIKVTTVNYPEKTNGYKLSIRTHKGSTPWQSENERPFRSVDPIILEARQDFRGRKGFQRHCQGSTDGGMKMPLKAYDEATGKEVKIGDKIVDFRGDEYTLVGIVRARSFGKSGKIEVEDNSGFSQVCYDKVFQIVVKEVEG